MSTEYGRFADKAMPVPEAGCWLWTGAVKSNGYGTFYLHGRLISAHRASMILHGFDVTGAVVMHKCDTPSCVNPAHLTIGTHRENSHDMFRKGRGRPNPSKGEGNPRALLTEADVRTIRASNEKTAALARRFGVSYWTIRDVRTGRRWQEVA